MSRIAVGTCGYRFYDPGEDWRSSYVSKLQAYSDAFAVGELNRTFYQLPQVETAARWRREAVEDFTFTLKAWQAITHPWSSPTWNGHRDAVPDDRTDELGGLRSTPFVLDAWERTRRVAAALEAEAVVVQTPPSFGCTDDHEADLRSFFDSVDRQGYAVGWEPRGDWSAHPDRVAAICDDLDLVHVVDVLRTDPVAAHDVAYTRLHGLNEDLYDYDYAYSADELEALVGRLEELAASHERVFCLFNNYEKQSDAVTTIEKLRERGAI